MTLNQKVLVKTQVYNALTHGLGVVLSVVGLWLLWNKALVVNNNLALVSYTIYGTSNILMFASSTLYHSFSFTAHKDWLQKLDHAAIYMLIAGTYTPVLLLNIGGTFGKIFFGLIWLIAIVGTVFEVGWTNRFPKLSTMLYLGMGWISIFLMYQLFQSMAWQGMFWLILGGLFYSIGTFFYRQKTKPWMHVIWHLFVLAGAIAMYVTIYFYT